MRMRLHIVMLMVLVPACDGSRFGMLQDVLVLLDGQDACARTTFVTLCSLLLSGSTLVA